MGLLDDAIREHLELRRRRGADPSEVAREQSEALDTPYQPPAERHAADELGTAPAAEQDVAAAAVGQSADVPDGALAAGTDAIGAPTIADELVAGETAELDMSTVLAHDSEDEEDGAIAEEDSLEWETPRRGEVSQEADPSPQPRVE